MDVWMASEEAYKKGYAKGYEDGKRDVRVKVHCINCVNSGSKRGYRNKVWCDKMCRYMKEDGFCSEGKTEV